MRRYSISLLLALCAIVATTAHTNADTGPSLSATDAWLQANLPQLTFGDDGYEHVMSAATYLAHRCTLIVHHKVESSPSSAADETTKYYRITFRGYPGRSLEIGKPYFHKDNSPNPLVTMAYSETVELNLANMDLASLRIVRFTLDGNQPETSAAMLMLFSPKEVVISSTDHDIAAQGLHALKHAALLCGAKTSPF